jgi:hypothetical protein
LHIQPVPSITTLGESPSSISNRRTLLKSKVVTSLVVSPKLSLLAPLEYSVVTTVLNTHFVGEVIVTPMRTWRLSRCGSLAWPKLAYGPIDWYSISRPRTVRRQRVSNPCGIASSCWPPVTNATASISPASSELSWPPHPKTRLANASNRMV